MRTAAAAASVLHSPAWGKDFPRIQILTIADLLHGAAIKMPPQHGTFKQAGRVQQPTAEQGQLDLG